MTKIKSQQKTFLENKKVFYFILISLLFSVNGFSQATNKFNTTGFAGVGTTSPTVPFEMSVTPTSTVAFKFGNASQANQIIFRGQGFFNFFKWD